MTARCSRLIGRLGDLGLWMGLYVSAGLLLAAWLCGPARLGGLPLVFALTLTVSVYLADRVKLLDRLVDPADERSHPARYRFMRHYARPIRAAAVVLAFAAAAVGWSIHPGLPLLVPAAHLGVLAYASLPTSVRPKNRLFLKNLAVAASIAALLAIVLVVALPDDWRWPPLAVVVIFLLLQVFADAMLCDIDDAESDRRFGTRTIPNTFGVRVTWRLALALSIGAQVVLLAGAAAGQLDVGASAWLAASLMVTLLLLAWWRPRPVRDAVDLRLPVAVAVALFLGM